MGKDTVKQRLLLCLLTIMALCMCAPNPQTHKEKTTARFPGRRNNLLSSLFPPGNSAFVRDHSFALPSAAVIPEEGRKVCLEGLLALWLFSHTVAF